VKSVSTLWAVADLAVAAAIDGRVLLMEGRRSTWQSWHIRAEAHRRIRVATVPTDKVEHLVELLVAEVLQTRSISLARPDDASQSLRSCGRVDGSSVSTVAGSQLFTSTGSCPPSSVSSPWLHPPR
jgi:hypothetical protein